MYILTLEGREDQGAYSVINEDGRQVLYLFEEEDDCDRFAMMLEEREGHPDLNVIGSAKALISNNADLETTVQNLTTGTDEAQGGGGKDTIGAAIGTNQTIANGTTFNPGDVIDGKTGSDTLKISIAFTELISKV